LLLHGGDRRLARRPHPVRLLRHRLHRRLRGGHGEVAAHAPRARRLRALAGSGSGRPAAPLRQRRRVRLAVGHDAGRGREAADGNARGGRDRPAAAAAGGLWAAVAGLEAQPAYAAMADLAAAPDLAVALVRRELKPVPALPNDAELDRTFADLDSEAFATREK